jgi:hypothetical protein
VAATALRTEAQPALMAYPTSQEQAEVMRGMRLLAEATRRRKDAEHDPTTRAG